MHVSVIMPVYNGEATVARAVKSIQAQTYLDWDMVIVDDGSKDRTWAILQDLARQDPRITLLANGKNRGVAASLNHALRHARGPLIARMDADDISLPMRFRQQVDFLTAHPQLDVLGTAAYVLEESLSSCPRLFRCPYETHPEIVATISRDTPFIHPSIMARKIFFETLGGYDERFSGAEDYDLFLRGYNYFQYHNLPTPLLYYHVHPQVTFYKLKINCKVLIKASWRDRNLSKYLLPIVREVLCFIYNKSFAKVLLTRMATFTQQVTTRSGK